MGGKEQRVRREENIVLLIITQRKAGEGAEGLEGRNL